MSNNDDDTLEEFDLSAWEAPPPPADLADVVMERMGATDVGMAVPVEEEPAEPKRGWLIAGVAAAVVVLGLGVWTLVRATHHAAPTAGAVVADRAQSLSLDTVHADLDRGADVRWLRKGNVLHVEQRAGNATWHVDGDETLVIDAGAALASVEAEGANLRVEVQMNAMDAKVIGASALTAAAVAVVSVVVYEGHVSVSRHGQQTVIVAPGSSYQVKAEPEPPVVGSGPVSVQDVARDKRIAVLGLEVVEPSGKVSGDAPAAAQVLSSEMRAIPRHGAGPYLLGPATDKELVDEKLLANCTNEAPACMAMIGENLGVDVLLYGHVQLVHDGLLVELKLLDVAHETVAKSAAWTIDAEVSGLDEWSTKMYFALVGGVATACDADALKDKGMENINMGQHAAALAQFEASLRCKDDSYVRQLAFMEACGSNNSAKAKHYYKQLTPAQQARFAQICIRQKVDYQDDETDTPTSLDRAAITNEMARIKPDIYACGDKAQAGGKVKVQVDVSPDGTVKDVEITETPSGELGTCIAAVIEKATFAPTRQGGSFSYPFLLPAKARQPANCDAEALKEKGMENINMGQHAAALAQFEASLRCKADPYVVQLAFMEACNAANVAKAKLYYGRLTVDQQAKFRPICIRQHIDPGPTSASMDAEGYLQVFAKPTAKIIVDGKDTGLTTPISGRRLKLEPGRHKVTFEVGQDHFTYPVLIKAGATETLSKDLR